MKDKAHLIMPMGGSGSRFSSLGFDVPKPLIELQGRPFFYWAIRSIEKFAPLKSLTFVVLREHIERHGIDKKIREYFPGARIVTLERVLNGAVLTCLAGVRDIADESPVFFNDCDHIFSCPEFERFLQAGDFSAPDGALLTFTSREPLYSYLVLDQAGRISGTVEKVAASDRAICGVYYFKNKALFERYSERYLYECSYKEFFVSGVYNGMAADGLDIRSFPTQMHIPFGVPQEYLAAKDNEAFKELL
ncbi:MAG: NTP transferase domain-containing protein [Oscillospiraceae bacterium]|nr:NTP transferase domain-containing protein [Oscillospiraceae bacterium]